MRDSWCLFHVESDTQSAVRLFWIAQPGDATFGEGPALAAVQRAFEDRAVEFGLMIQYPAFKAIATEPAFLSIIGTVGR